MIIRNLIIIYLVGYLLANLRYKKTFSMLSFWKTAIISLFYPIELLVLLQSVLLKVTFTGVCIIYGYGLNVTSDEIDDME